MLRWMMGIKRIEKTRNEEMEARAGVANMSEKMGYLNYVCIKE